MHMFKSALRNIKYCKLALDAFLKRNALRYFLEVARLPQDLIGNGNHWKKKNKIKKVKMI